MNIVTLNIRNIKMKKIPHKLFFTLFVAFSLSAEEISIPESANWLITLDGEAFHKTRMGKFIMGKINENPNVKQKIDGLKNAFWSGLAEN